MSTSNASVNDQSTSTTSSGQSSSESDQSDLNVHDSSSSNSDQEEINNPLYDGSSLSAKNSMQCFFAFKPKHNLSSQATDSILKLIKLFLPEGNKCPASGYQFEKSLQELGYQYTK